MIEAAQTAIADIETTKITYGSGGRMILPDKVHLIVAQDYERKKTHVFGPDEDSLREGVDFLERSHTVVFHNGIGFDVPVLKKQYGLKRKHDRHFIDSLVLCQLFYSNVKEEEDFRLFEKTEKLPDGHPLKFTGKLIGSHSLEAWGLRLKNPVKKGNYGKTSDVFPDFDPWAQWSQDMQDYAVQDVVTLAAIWTERLRDRFHQSANEEAIAIEHYLAELMEQLKDSGIKLDIPHAEKLCEELEAKAVELEAQIAAEFPPRYEPVKWRYKELPLGFPEWDDEQQKFYDENKNKPELADKVEELFHVGPQQQLTLLMYEHKDSPVYRPRFNLPPGYIREWYGEVTNPKVTRTFNDKKTGEFKYATTAGDPFVKVELTPLNPRSRVQIVRRLLEFGWTPEEFTETGNPSVSEVELHKIEEQFPAAASIAKYLLIQKRLGQIKTGDKAWLKLVDDDGFLHPTIRACNTVAFRATHSDPNVSQVPSVKMADMIDENGNKVRNESGKVKQRVRKGEDGKWGYECRAAFTVPEGFVMVGSDLAGIEMRAWAHYLTPYDNGYFADVVLNKDVHEENRVILGFDDRRKAKEYLYALMYGAGDPKLGFIIDPHASLVKQQQLGAASRARFMYGLQGYDKLNEQLMLGVRRGHLKGLDGRRVPVRKQHAALNALLQSAGAIISKYWIFYVLDILEGTHGMKYGYENDYTLMIYSHDEIQIATRPQYQALVEQACIDGALAAGRHLEFRLPVEVGIAHGQHWGDTH